MLALESVVGGYGETTVLRDVSLTVPEASVVALLGANGAGKTTVMRVASGELRPRAGRVVMDGRDISSAAPFQRWKLGICHIPEGRAVFPGLTVRENLVTFAKARAEEALHRATEAFPVLASRLGQRAGTLSGGEQQMLALARAYVTEPRVVLLDEVSMGLAPQNRRRDLRLHHPAGPDRHIAAARRAVRQPGARARRPRLRPQPGRGHLQRAAVGARRGERPGRLPR